MQQSATGAALPWCSGHRPEALQEASTVGNWLQRFQGVRTVDPRLSRKLQQWSSGSTLPWCSGHRPEALQEASTLGNWFKASLVFGPQARGSPGSINSGQVVQRFPGVRAVGPRLSRKLQYWATGSTLPWCSGRRPEALQEAPTLVKWFSASLVFGP